MEKSSRKERNQKNIVSILRALGKCWGLKLVVAVCMLLVVCMETYADSTHYAYAFLSLDYENASKGLYPNGTRFNMYDIISDDMVNEVIEQAGLTDVLSATELANSLSVSPRYTRDPSELYIGTEYVIELYLRRNVKHENASNLLLLLCRAFSDFFTKSYADNDTLYSYAVGDTTDYDYTEIGDLFKTRLSQLKDYLSRRNAENAVFHSDSTGETFASLIKRVDNFSNVLYDRYVSFVTENGVSKDPASRTAEINYRQYLLNNRYNRLLLEYDVRLDAIDHYNTKNSSILMIPTYDSNGAFYMSKTKTGMDYLAAAAQNCMDQAKEMRLTILNNELLLKKLEEAAGSETQQRQNEQQASEMIESMLGEMNTLIRDIKATDDDYIEYTLSKSLTFQQGYISTKEIYGVTKGAIVFAGVYLGLSALQLLDGAFKKRKGQFTLRRQKSKEAS